MAHILPNRFTCPEQVTRLPLTLRGPGGEARRPAEVGWRSHSPGHWELAGSHATVQLAVWCCRYLAGTVLTGVRCQPAPGPRSPPPASRHSVSASLRRGAGSRPQSPTIPVDQLKHHLQNPFLYITHLLVCQARRGALLQERLTAALRVGNSPSVQSLVRTYIQGCPAAPPPRVPLHK